MNTRQYDFIDILSILSFLISLQNLDENLSQSDKADLQGDLAEKADMLLSEIHAHLEKQDRYLQEIKEILNDG